MRFVSRIRLWFSLRYNTKAQKYTAQWTVESSELLEKLEHTERSLNKRIEEFEKLSKTAQGDIKRIKEQNTKLLVALESLRNENKVMAEVTIPALNAACQLGLERWNAETAIQVRRQVAIENKEIK